MRVGIIVEGDQFVYKTDSWKLDWRVATHWPFDAEEVHSSRSFFINTKANEKGMRKKAIPFENAAKAAGFEVVWRLEKKHESDAKNQYSRGSTALMGALAESLAWHVDELVVHAWQPAAARAMQTVVEYHEDTHLTVVASAPCDEFIALAQSCPDRVRIIDPNPGRATLEFDPTSTFDPPTVPMLDHASLTPSPGMERSRRIGKVADFGNIHGWARAIGCEWDGIFDLRQLLAWRPQMLEGQQGSAKPDPATSMWIVPMLDDATGIRRASLDRAREAGWGVHTAPVVGGTALDDGVIGVGLARASHLCEVVMLLSGDIDFDAVLWALRMTHDTRFFRLAPPPMRKPHNSTSRYVIRSKNAEFIPLNDMLQDVFHVSNEYMPNHLSLNAFHRINPRNKNRKRQFAEEKKAHVEKVFRTLLKTMKARTLQDILAEEEE